MFHKKFAELHANVVADRESTVGKDFEREFNDAQAARQEAGKGAKKRKLAKASVEPVEMVDLLGEMIGNARTSEKRNILIRELVYSRRYRQSR